MDSYDDGEFVSFRSVDKIFNVFLCNGSLVFSDKRVQGVVVVNVCNALPVGLDSGSNSWDVSKDSQRRKFGIKKSTPRPTEA